MLNFGAVDWKADIWVNDIKVGQHTGGFTPFSLDITAALATKGDNKLVVKVWDPTDRGPQPRGKQVNRPEGIWYTAVTVSGKLSGWSLWPNVILLMFVRLRTSTVRNSQWTLLPVPAVLRKLSK